MMTTKKYKDLGCKVELVRFSPIDPSYTADAESDIKSFFSGLGFNLDNKKYVEITIFGDKNKKVVNEQYKLISDKYMGKYKEIKENMDLIISQAECRVANAEKECQVKVSEFQHELLVSNQRLVDAKQDLVDSKQDLVDSKQETLDIERRATKDKDDLVKKYESKIKKLKANPSKQSQAKPSWGIIIIFCEHVWYVKVTKHTNDKLLAEFRNKIILIFVYNKI